MLLPNACACQVGQPCASGCNKPKTGTSIVTPVMSGKKAPVKAKVAFAELRGHTQAPPKKTTPQKPLAPVKVTRSALTLKLAHVEGMGHLAWRSCTAWVGTGHLQGSEHQ